MGHTPGPWFLHGKPGYEALEIFGTNRPIAKSLYHLGSEDNEADANARRIVACVNACEGINPEAVPELLAVCKLLVAARAASEGYLDERALVNLNQATEMAEAAIAKAKGEPCT